MPTTDMDSDAAADQEAAADQGSRQQELAGIIPPADEPLKPQTLNALAQVIAQTMAAIAGHKVELPYAPVSEPMEQVPQDLGSQIVAMAAMGDKLGQEVPELEPYRFDPVEAMSSNAGLQELTITIGQMAKDKELIAALRAPTGGKDGSGKRADNADGDGGGEGTGGAGSGAARRPAPAAGPEGGSSGGEGTRRPRG